MPNIELVRGKTLDREMDWSPSTRKRHIASGRLRKPLEISPGIKGWTRDYIERFKAELIADAEARAAARDAAA